ncbi:outer membrane lipoprotein chaperone LolA [Neptunicella sp. SCSIO 80796]|uniref:outer membrane lipoprotein chaperone LolA n=1 Tax=Neptunicella plasticusilytica TaxID=3117012 RepID=UPI003A4E5EE7
MKKFLTLPLLVIPLLITNLSFADTAKTALQDKLTQLQSYSADFNQKVTDAQGQVLQQSTGSIQLLQPNKLHWQVNEPNENILIADGHTLWHVDPFVEQVIALDQAEAVKNNPIVLLAEPQSDAWQSYSISQQGNKFEVVTSAETSQIAKLVFIFEQDKLTELQIVDRQEQLSQLIFSHIQQGQDIDSKLFDFSMPEGFSLDDQRNDPAGL